MNLAPHPGRPVFAGGAPVDLRRIAAHGRRLLLDAGTFAVTFALAAGISLTLYARYGTSMDLAIFYQGLANLAGLYPAGVAIKTPGAELFGDHFHPIVLVAVPLLRCWNSPAALLVLQSAAIAAAVCIFAGEARRQPETPAGALLALVASPAIWGAAAYDVHEVALGSPLVAALCALLLQRRWRVAALAAACCMLIKEDMGALILPCALLIAWAGHRVLGALLALWVSGWTWLVTTRVIPAFNASHHYTYNSGKVLAGAPSALLHSLVTPGLLTLSLAVILAATGGRFSHRWLLLPAMGNLAYRACIDNFRYWIPAYHYWLLPYIFIAFSTIGWTAPPRPWRKCLMATSTALSILAGPATLALAATVPTNTRAIDSALGAVPAGSRAAADPRFAARLSTKAVVSIATPREPEPPESVDWLVLDTSTRSYGGGWVGTYAHRLDDEFDTIYRRDGLIVLHRRQPSQQHRDCVTNALGTLCIDARSQYYDVAFTATDPVQTADLTFNLKCNDGTWLGDLGAFTTTPGSTATYAFYVGRTTHDACAAHLRHQDSDLIVTRPVRAD